MGRRFFSILIFFGSFGLLGYMAWHAFDGPRSFEHEKKLLVELASLKAEEHSLRKERERFQDKILLLRAETLDLDLLDETARRLLGYMPAEEVMVYERP